MKSGRLYEYEMEDKTPFERLFMLTQESVSKSSEKAGCKLHAETENDSFSDLLIQIETEFTKIMTELLNVIEAISPLAEHLELKPALESSFKELTHAQRESIETKLKFIQNRLTLLESLIKQLDSMNKAKMSYNINHVNKMIEMLALDNKDINARFKFESWFIKQQPEGTVYNKTQKAYAGYVKDLAEFFKRTESLRKTYPAIRESPGVDIIQ